MPLRSSRLRGKRVALATGAAASLALVTLVVIALPLAGPVACGGCNTKITTPSLPDGVVGVEYDVDLDASCGGDAWFLDQGNLPPGILLIDNGKLRGAPTLAGVYTFTIGVVDFDDGDFAFRGFALTVLEAG